MECPACGSTATREVWVDRWPGGFEKHIRRCHRCGLAATSPLPSPDELGDLYSAAEYFSSEPDAHLGYTQYNPPLEWLCDVLRAAIRFQAAGPVLEVGSATGEFLLLAGRRGLEGIGIEPSRWAAERAIAAGVETRIGLFGEAAASLANEGFGIVAMSHVIEHLDDPAAAVTECARLLRPGGALALWTPNYAAASWQDPRKAYELEGREHLFYFTPRSLRAIVEAAGLQVRSLVSRPCPTPGAWLEAERFRGRKPSLRRWGDKAFTWAYKGILRGALQPMRWADLILVATKR